MLVHGLDGDKNSFLQSGGIFSECYHLVLTDLAGLGGNAESEPGLLHR